MELQEKLEKSPKQSCTTTNTSTHAATADSGQRRTTVEPPPAQRREETRETVRKSSLEYYNCRQTGHFSRDCPEPSRRRQPGNIAETEPKRVNVSRNVKSPGKKTYLRMHINGHSCTCLLDTGCEKTVLPARLIDPATIKPTNQRFVAANGTELSVLGSVRVYAHIGRQSIPIDDVVSEVVHEVMMGIDWMEENDAIWMFGQGAIKIRGQKYKL